MGKFDSPFHLVKEDVVSIWASTVPWEEFPDDYFTRDYDDDDDDAPWNRFSEDFGFGCYDEDFVDTNGSKDHSMVPITDLLGPCSYGASFSEAAACRAEALGVARTNYIILLYNFRYDPAISGIDRSECMQFIGVFPFRKDESSA